MCFVLNLIKLTSLGLVSEIMHQQNSKLPRGYNKSIYLLHVNSLYLHKQTHIYKEKKFENIY